MQKKTSCLPLYCLLIFVRIAISSSWFRPLSALQFLYTVSWMLVIFVLFIYAPFLFNQFGYCICHPDWLLLPADKWGNLNWDIFLFNMYQNCFKILPTFQYVFFCFFFPVDLGQFISYFVPICSVVIESDLCCTNRKPYSKTLIRRAVYLWLTPALPGFIWSILLLLRFVLLIYMLCFKTLIV